MILIKQTEERQEKLNREDNAEQGINNVFRCPNLENSSDHVVLAGVEAQYSSTQSRRYKVLLSNTKKKITV